MEKCDLYLFISLLTAHLISDFTLQTRYVAFNKLKMSVLIYHGIIVAFLSYLLVGVWDAWIIPLFIFFTHSATDYIKAKIDIKGIVPFLTDQIVHIIMIVVLVLIIRHMEWSDTRGISLYWVDYFGLFILKIMVVISGFICVVRVSDIIIQFITEPLEEQLDYNLWVHKNRFQYGSCLIGKLERVMILILFLINQPTGIGFLITAKSILRFEKISGGQNRMESEYVIIGTLLSFIMGISSGWLTLYVLGIL